MTARFPEHEALVRNFVKGVEVWGDEATPTYAVSTPSDGVTSEGASAFFCPVRPTY